MGRDAPARFFDLLAEPNFLEVVVMVAQVAEIVCSHAAGPDGTVRVNVGAHPARIAFNNLVFLVENALDQRSEEHTSELQSHSDLVCRLLLEKKKVVKKLQVEE